MRWSRWGLFGVFHVSGIGIGAWLPMERPWTESMGVGAMSPG